jgi:DNA topoisomerase-1
MRYARKNLADKNDDMRGLSFKKPYTVIIAEKPKAAQKIAEALNAYRKIYINGVPVYIARYDGKELVIAPAAGHLFTLSTDVRGYPVYEYKWVPRHLVEKSYSHIEKFYKMFSKIMREASEYINACDYDVEGSVIGYMIIKEWGDPSKAKRMKFSTLTKEDIIRSFRYLEPLDINMIEAGIARHELDWIWGINISRALTDLYRKKYESNKIISAGRVQTPTLYEVLSRYVERETFVPSPLYRISLKGSYDNKIIEFEDIEDPLKTKEDAQILREKIIEEGFIKIVDSSEKTLEYSPPHPFNLGDIQTEAYELYGYSPSETLKILEDLYLEGLISYPRTNSQKLPQTLNHREILFKLSKIREYKDHVNKILYKKALVPHNGPKDDPAHPAIYPTGETPSKRLDLKYMRIYDLVVRRYIATFSDSAIVSEIIMKGCVAKRCFRASGRRIIKKGWLETYHFYRIEEKFIPKITVGIDIPVKEVKIIRSYTRPVKLYDRASLLRWMERENIGTESTRAEIIDTLFKRGYVSGRNIKVSELGIEVVNIISKYFPELLSTALTRRFEEYLQDIINGRMKRSVVIKEAIDVVNKLIKRFREEAIDNINNENKDQRCVICRLERDKNSIYGFCYIHEIAYRNLVNTFENWRSDGYDWSSYIEKIYRSKLTGSYVKEVIEYLRRRSRSL